MVKVAPEPAFCMGRPEPAAVFTVRPGSNQRREVAPLRPLIYFILKPPGVQARFLGVGEFPVTRHDDNLRPLIACDVRPVSLFFPSHLAPRFDVPGVNQDIAIPVTLQHRYHLHAKTHFRRPEPLEPLPAKEMTSKA